MEQVTEKTSNREQGYRYHYLQADIKLSTWVILIWLTAVVIFIPVDYFSLELTKEFYTFLSARLLFAGCIFTVILGLRRTTNPRHYDILISLAIALGVVFSALGHFMFEQDMVGQLILDVLVIITIYAIFPGPLNTKIIASLILSAKSTYPIFAHGQVNEQILDSSGASIVTGIVIANILGYYSWKAIDNFRHQQYNTLVELEQTQKEAEYLARIDPLTEINNRRAFMESSKEEFSRAQRYQRMLSLALIDIDNLKSINDKYGHQAGDMVLKMFSNIFNNQIREQDILGRIGGDEFGLLLPETALEEAGVIVTRHCERFRQTNIEFQNQHISTTFSAGIAIIQSSDQSFEQLIRRSDQKLYQAKKTGKGHIKL